MFRERPISAGEIVATASFCRLTLPGSLVSQLSPMKSMVRSDKRSLPRVPSLRFDTTIQLLQHEIGTELVDVLVMLQKKPELEAMPPAQAFWTSFLISYRMIRTGEKMFSVKLLTYPLSVIPYGVVTGAGCTITRFLLILPVSFTSITRTPTNLMIV